MNRSGSNGNGAANGECGCRGCNGESFSLLHNRTVNASVGISVLVIAVCLGMSP